MSETEYATKGDLVGVVIMLGIAVLVLAFYAGDLRDRIEALETPPAQESEVDGE